MSESSEPNRWETIGTDILDAPPGRRMMRLWEDRRVGGHSRLRLISEDWEARVRVPDEIRKCVCFIYSESQTGVKQPRGTAFFMGVERTRGLLGAYVYLVTAKHVIAGIRATSPNGIVHLRCNTIGGSVKWISSHVDQWWLDDDPSLVSDAAVLALPGDIDDLEYLMYPVTACWAVNDLEKNGLGVGDEVFITGLFVNHAGRERNIPIVRMGNISALPDEPVQTLLGPMDAYLIEARSIGGLSGSPVFIHTMPIRLREGKIEIYRGPDSNNPFFLIGLTHGHYQVSGQPAHDSLSDEAINMGIAIVAPISQALKLIMQEDAVIARNAQDEAEARSGLPVTDEAEGTEFERFEDLTRKLAQVPKKEIDEKRKERGQ